ncbi:MAG: T9SS type A sorting domain-containing protein, partial [Bacteroidetes bacterium]|nr:T9SS type A sorting domain-containing protein [Bacteroidota bacterium]
DNGGATLNDVDSYISWERGFTKSMMGIPQSFAWNATPPNAAEYRNMVYQHIINNVKGYLPYVWYDSGNYLPNYTAMFNEAKAIHPELKGELVQAIMNGVYTRDNSGVSPDLAGVKAAFWAYNGNTYVVVVNTSGNSQTVSIQLPFGTTGTLSSLFKRLPNTLTFNGGKLTGNIGKQEVEVYKIVSSLTGIQANNKAMLPTLSILPNPARGNTLVRYLLATDYDVKITLHDLLGKELMQIANEKQTIGEHDLTINTESLLDGIYFVKISINEKQIVQKLLISKSE